MSYHFCTYFDINYLPRALTLRKSLERHCPGHTLWVLCMDDEVFDVLGRLDLPGVRAVALAEFEADDASLLAAKPKRSRIEYYFTCSPSWPLYVLERHPEVDAVTYLDTDLYFFSDPAPLFAELGENGAVAIVGHRFPERLRHLERLGVYNVSWMTFRRDERAFECLRWWRERCLEWCHDYEDDGRYADQKYLDDWPERFPGVVVLSHPGANLAPWNLDGRKLSKTGDGVLVDGSPLVFFHFHHLRKLSEYCYDPSWRWYGVEPSRGLRRDVYGVYLRELRDARAEAAKLHAAGIANGIRHQQPANSATAETAPPGLPRRFLNAAKAVLGRKLIFMFGDQIF